MTPCFYLPCFNLSVNAAIATDEPNTRSDLSLCCMKLFITVIGRFKLLHISRKELSKVDIGFCSSWGHSTPSGTLAELPEASGTLAELPEDSGTFTETSGALAELPESFS